MNLYELVDSECLRSIIGIFFVDTGLTRFDLCDLHATNYVSNFDYR